MAEGGKGIDSVLPNSVLHVTGPILKSYIKQTCNLKNLKNVVIEWFKLVMEVIILVSKYSPYVIMYLISVWNVCYICSCDALGG